MNKTELIICAGFGGQGIITLGKVLASCGMEEGFHVSCIPSYGAEVRGGTAHVMVTISQEMIGNPIIQEATTLIAMNTPSFEKFKNKVSENGNIIYNESLIKEKYIKKGIKCFGVDLTKEATKIGNIKVANMISAGIFLGITGVFKKETLNKVMEKMAQGRESILPANIKAVERGIEIAEEINKN